MPQTKVYERFQVEGYYPSKRFDKDELTKAMRQAGWPSDTFKFNLIGAYTTVLQVNVTNETAQLGVAKWMHDTGIGSVKLTHNINTYISSYYNPETGVAMTDEEYEEREKQRAQAENDRLAKLEEIRVKPRTSKARKRVEE